MGNITLLDLRNGCKERANMENSSFVSDSEWDKYINYSITELRDILISKVGEDYFAEEELITLVNNQESYPLPADFYKLISLQVKLVQGRWGKLTRFEISEAPCDLKYRIRSDVILLSNPDKFGGNILKLVYQPIHTKLTSDSDVLNGYNGWDEFVILKSARKALVKQEQSVVDVDAELAGLYARLETMGTNRDQSEPMRVQDLDFTINWNEKIW